MLLEVCDVSLRYPGSPSTATALHQVSLNVDQGEMVGLMGTSGSGKTSLARVICGLTRADAGRMSFNGASCDVATPLRRRSDAFRQAHLNLQMVFQHPASTFADHMTLAKAVAEGIVYRNPVRQDVGSLVLKTLERVGLPTSYANRYAWELSGGECQRAAIARAIIGGPKLLVCDEPTSSLDATVQAQIVALLQELCSTMGMACLFISHDLALVQQVCSRAYVMEAGRIVEEGPCTRLFTHPQTAATQALLDAVIEL